MDQYLHLLSAFWHGAAPPYQKALDECFLIWRGGPISISTLRMQILVHSILPPTTNEQKSRQRNNILWYNPPFSKNVSTDIGRQFFALIDKHFPKDHKLRRIFNHNTIKISYSCMNSTKQVTDTHKKCILN